MKKLLLLTISLVSFSTYGCAGVWQNSYSDSTHKDSLKNTVISDPKAGFKNLFVDDVSEQGFNTAHLNPRAVSFVEDYVDKHADNLNKMKGWGRPYFDIMNNILAKHGLPTELKYLSVIESALKTYSVSWAGAVGPWQFMPATARNLGLRVNSRVDERTDFHKSTHAAARYLTQLYGLYSDWLLVIAAYNCGPGVVNSAIRKSGSRNFWDLQYYLPTESRNHVKKFIATHYIMEGEGGITTLTKKEADNLAFIPAAVKETGNDANLAIQNISGKYHSLIISQFAQINIIDFNRLNPGFDKLMATNGSVDLKLPADKMLLFQANKPQILEQSIRLLLTMDAR